MTTQPDKKNFRENNILKLTEDLQNILTPIGIQASNDTLYKGAVFGRDSLRVAEDLIDHYPNISKRIIFSLASHQGMSEHLESEEELGRIHHEYRSCFLGQEQIEIKQRKIMERLAENWGWLVPNHELCYYGSVDATPQYVRLIFDYINKTHDKNFLNQKYRHHNGKIITIHKSLLLALGWIEKRLDNSTIGLLEFQRKHEKGHPWQVMRDGLLSYAHPNGQLVNMNKPVASLEVQGLTYDALIGAVEILGLEFPHKKDKWLKLANKLQEKVLKLFWIKKDNFFAMAIDRNPKNNAIRQVKTISSVPAELLETRIFDSLSLEIKNKYIHAIVEKMYSDEFLTQAGIRSWSIKHTNIFKEEIWNYHGVHTVWGVTANVFAKGLHKQGFNILAEDMENRLINACGTSGSSQEFFYVDSHGKIAYKILKSKNKKDNKETPIIKGVNIPEKTQAWTVSALLRANLAKKVNQKKITFFEKEISNRITLEHRRSHEELANTFANSNIFILDSNEAIKAKGRIFEKNRPR